MLMTILETVYTLMIPLFILGIYLEDRINRPYVSSRHSLVCAILIGFFWPLYLTFVWGVPTVAKKWR